jgi:DNA-binding transcriptional LysR family regulator
MDLRQLRYFSTVAEELHFGRAARKLFISQPALSADIRRLEQELGVQLLERSSKAVTLTNAGQVLLREAKRLLQQADEARHLTLMSARGVMGRLRIGFVNSLIHRGLPEALERFETEHPSVDVTLSEMNTAEQIDALLRNQLDMGLSHSARFPASLHAEQLAVEPFLCCLPPAHPLAGRAGLSIKDLRDDAFILFPRRVSPYYHDQIIALCVEAGFSPRIKHEVRLWQTVVGMVEKSMGIALVPRSIALACGQHVACIPLEGVRATSETLCLWSGDAMPAVAQLFVTCLRQALSRPGEAPATP